ncbi:MAG: hypothetical protein IT380_10265 [Myxococcales bacterium]|nr:hypothetical protein [Myxococcales bacterium]
MKRVGVLLLTVCAFTAQAAEVTRVASSFEDDDPFGMFLDFTFDRTQDSAKIVREWYQDSKITDVTELRYNKFETKLAIDVALGLYKDLELHVGVPIIFQQDRYWSFAAGTDANNTTLYRNCSDARGNLCTTPGQGTGHLFEVGDPSASYRSGLGDFQVGLGWAPFVQKKDWSKPTWVLRFDWTIPTATKLNPSVPTTSGSRGAIGDRLHKYTFSTAVSKRLWFAEPYVNIWYTLPWRGPNFYSNCDDPSDERLGRAENCGGPHWTREETGIRPAHTGGVVFGSELTVFEKAENHQRVAFDLRGFFSYTSEGRYYSEVSDLLGKLTYVSDYGQVGGQLGFVGQAAEFVTLRAYASLAYNTERVLTNENIGHDIDGNGTVDVTANPSELNPNFDNRLDRPGRRLRVEEQSIFRITVTATFNF